jgi:hypothetical protein
MVWCSDFVSNNAFAPIGGEVNGGAIYCLGTQFPL